MKKCIKCNNEYKDDYIYCPKCGNPYDSSKKAVKTPGDIVGTSTSILKKIGVIAAYVFGSIMILSAFITPNNFVSSLVSILLGLSFFKIIYTFIGNKLNIDDNKLLIIRIVVPVILLLLFGLVNPTTDSDTAKKTNNNEQNTIVESNQKNEEVEDTVEEKPTPVPSPSPSQSPIPSNSTPMDALRKCSVMEAADIYTTGIGQKTDNVFNDGRATCETMRDSFGESEFIEIIDTDWENRKSELIDGKPLSYYLGILGW